MDAQIDISTALAIGAVIFAAGGAWMTLSRTDKRGAAQGKRIGKLEGRVAHLEGMLRVRRLSAPMGNPIVPDADEDGGA